MARIEHLKSFCLIAELRSFSLAAEQCGLSQPALSQQVKALEEEYQTELLHRKGSRIALTEDGKRVYKYALEILSLYKLSLEEVAPGRKQINGDLLVGASSGPGEFPVPVLLCMYKKEHPDISVSLKAGDTNEIIDLVLNHSLEIGFVGNQRPDSHLTFQPIFNDRMVLVVHPQHPFAARKHISIEEFLTIPLIMQQKGAGVRETFLESLKAQGIQPEELNVLMELGLQDSAKSAVMAGFGGAVISRLGGVNEIAAGKLVEISVEDLDFNRPMYLCVNRTLPLSNLAMDFLRFTESKKEQLIADYLRAINHAP